MSVFPNLFEVAEQSEIKIENVFFCLQPQPYRADAKEKRKYFLPNRVFNFLVPIPRPAAKKIGCLLQTESQSVNKLTQYMGGGNFLSQISIKYPARFA